MQAPHCREGKEPGFPTPTFCTLAGEKPFLCDKCGRGFNRVDNLRSHVKTVHQGKAGMKMLDIGEGDALNIVTVASDEMVTLATEALAATAVTQLTGEAVVGLAGGSSPPPPQTIHVQGDATGALLRPLH